MIIFLLIDIKVYTKMFQFKCFEWKACQNMNSQHSSYTVWYEKRLRLWVPLQLLIKKKVYKNLLIPSIKSDDITPRPGANLVDGSKPNVVGSVRSKSLQLEWDVSGPSPIRMDVGDLIVVLFIILGHVANDFRPVVFEWSFDVEGCWCRCFVVCCCLERTGTWVLKVAREID